MSGGDALDRLARAVPPKVREVCATITAAGYQAVTVGGAVRDVLMRRRPSDWDVASSALPDDVLRLFKRTIATGLQHGTVTVVLGHRDDERVEVTTYRGEGAYSDARRPDSVEFGVPLERDLARRDLTVNAIAYDPANQVMIDPFDGQGDIAKRRLRAVGTAVDRFTEDGLRVMRAVRFAAQLEFELESDTEAAIAPALSSLAKVSRERVSIELRKTLEAHQPSRGLRPAYRTGIVASILPALPPAIDDVDAWIARIDRAAKAVRMGAMMAPLGDRAVVEATLKALKFSNQEAELAAQLVAVADASMRLGGRPSDVRRLLSEVARDKREHTIELWASEADPNRALIAEARRVLAAREPLDAKDLAIRGNDLMKELDMKPGPALGRVLAVLLSRVLDHPAKNTREALLAEARGLELELGIEDEGSGE